MTEESQAAMMRALDDVKLDADMRAMAENAMQHFASLTAEPSAVQIVAESQAESDAGGAGGGMDAPTGMTVAPMVPEPYHPVSPFRLKFSFGSDGSYSGVTVEDPVFLWNEPDEDGNPSVSLKTAGVGTIGLNGAMYLNITLSGEDGTKKFALAEVSMSSDGDISVPLYQLDSKKGVVKDYRHAMISLGTPGSGARRTGTREYVGGVRYDLSSQQIQQCIMIEDLATGATTPKTGQGYDNGWTMIENGQAVPHSGEA